MDRRKKAILNALERRRGGSQEAHERLKKAGELKDWRGKCRKCGAELEGSISEIKAHSCGEPGPEVS